jgi:ABC-type bacteriocin/lantibiotic exporter with double-glycine peptidase domain
MSAPIRSLHRIYDEINSAMIYSESFFSILEADHEIEASGLMKPQIHGKFELGKMLILSIRMVIKPLHRINMTIQPNKITALVGLSGAGKSTLISLLDKFYALNQAVSNSMGLI